MYVIDLGHSVVVLTLCFLLPVCLLSVIHIFLLRSWWINIFL